MATKESKKAFKEAHKDIAIEDTHGAKLYKKGWHHSYTGAGEVSSHPAYLEGYGEGTDYKESHDPYYKNQNKNKGGKK